MKLDTKAKRIRREAKRMKFICGVVVRLMPRNASEAFIVALCKLLVGNIVYAYGENEDANFLAALQNELNDVPETIKMIQMTAEKGK